MGSVLEIKGLSISVNKRQLLQNVTFSVNAGEAVLLSGTNGVGKSTLLKAVLRLETEGKQIEGTIAVRGFGDVLSLKGNELQKYRSRIAYVQQKDEYSQMGSVRVKDIISDNSEAFSGKRLSSAEVNELIDEWIPRRADNSRVFDANSKPGRFSGGEQRLLSVLSVLVSRPEAELLIIDEPLNNLDFVNARVISNLINNVFRKNSGMGLLMISHCRIFPFITREIKLTSEGAVSIPDRYECHSCFGEPDENGYFN